MPNLNIIALDTCYRAHQDVCITAGSSVYFSAGTLIIPELKSSVSQQDALVFQKNTGKYYQQSEIFD